MFHNANHVVDHPVEILNSYADHISNSYGQHGTIIIKNFKFMEPWSIMKTMIH